MSDYKNSWVYVPKYLIGLPKILLQSVTKNGLSYAINHLIQIRIYSRVTISMSLTSLQCTNVYILFYPYTYVHK